LQHLLKIPRTAEYKRVQYIRAYDINKRLKDLLGPRRKFNVSVNENGEFTEAMPQTYKQPAIRVEARSDFTDGMTGKEYANFLATTGKWQSYLQIV